MDLSARLGAVRCGCLLVAVLAGCATPVPGPTRVVSMSAQEGAAHEGMPPPGAVWRLDERELQALGPILPTPDPPPAPPVRKRVEPRLIEPSFIYFGSRYGFGWHDPWFWPRYRAYPYSPYYRHPWR